MPTTRIEDDLELAHRLADAARDVAISYFRGELKRRSKPDGSLVTDADEAAEDRIREILAFERPGDAVLGEERGESGAGSRRWLIDGIDGTEGFAAGTEAWGTLIALEVEGRVTLGLCDQPVRDRRTWAVKGAGAYRSDGSADAVRRLKVTTAHVLSSARSYVPEDRYLRDDRTRRAAGSLAAATDPRSPFDHPGLQVATGDYEVALFTLAGPWDIAAPALIVEEAGGRFSDMAGQWRLASGNAVFTNGVLHDAVLDVVTSA